jgi:hypothetical protein
MNKSDKATANFSFTASASAPHRVLGGQVPRRVHLLKIPRKSATLSTKTGISVEMCWMFISYVSIFWEHKDSSMIEVAQDRLLDEKICNKYCGQTTSGKESQSNHVQSMILRTCHVDLDILRILWPERVLSICDPQTDSIGMKKRHAHHITVCRSHSLCGVSNWEPLGNKRNVFHHIAQQQMDTNGHFMTFRGLELELGIVAESCALRRVWTPLWNFEKAQVWCLSKTPRKYWSIEAKRLIKS